MASYNRGSTDNISAIVVYLEWQADTDTDTDMDMDTDTDDTDTDLNTSLKRQQETEEREDSHESRSASVSASSASPSSIPASLKVKIDHLPLQPEVDEEAEEDTGMEMEGAEGILEGKEATSETKVSTQSITSEDKDKESDKDVDKDNSSPNKVQSEMLHREVDEEKSLEEVPTITDREEMEEGGVSAVSSQQNTHLRRASVSKQGSGELTEEATNGGNSRKHEAEEKDTSKDKERKEREEKFVGMHSQTLGEAGKGKKGMLSKGKEQLGKMVPAKAKAKPGK
jgi:hypothetical protein